MNIRAFGVPFVLMAVCGVGARLVGRAEATPDPDDGPPPALSLANLYYVPEPDLLTFTVGPAPIDPRRFRLLVQGRPGDDPIAALPLKAYNPPDEPVVVQMGGETGLRALKTITTVSPRGRSSRAVSLYAVDVSTLAAGRYRVRLDGSPAAAAMPATTVEIPERQALLALSFPGPAPRPLRVGDVFDVPMRLANTGPAAARGVEVTLTLVNQQFRSVDPALPARQDGDRVTLTLPDVPSGATLSFRLRYRAAAADESARLIAGVRPNRLEHPRQRNKDVPAPIGRIAPG